MTRPTGIVAIAILLAVGGCGGSAGPVSSGELVDQADELCSAEQRRFDEIQQRPPATAEDAVEQTEELLEVAAETQEGLEEIEPPSDLSRAYERYLEARRRGQLELIDRGREAAERHDRVSYGSAQDKSIEAGRERRRLARAVGLEVCGRG